MINKNTNLNNKYVSLATFCVGGGTKWLQSQFDGTNSVFTIPAYPLKYFYPHWRIWRNKIINKKIILELILKHHKSIIDSRSIKGFNGLTTLGKKKNKYIKISEKKFRFYFLSYLKKKKINSRCLMNAIHYAYINSYKNKKFKYKKILVHIHEPKEVIKEFQRDFKKCKSIFISRDPIDYFWKRIKNDQEIEKKRFDYTDKMIISFSSYFSSLISIFDCFLNVKNKKFFQRNLFIKFEDLKKNNKETLIKICKFIKVKYENKMKEATFNELQWNSSPHYKKKNPSKLDISFFEYKRDKNNFFKYEILILKYVLYPFLLKLNYEKKPINFNLFLFFICLFLPTKYGIKKMIEYTNLNKMLIFFKNLYTEIYRKKNIKNYYFNAMYKFKPQYNYALYIKFNFLRKKLYYSNQKSQYLRANIYKFFYFSFKSIYYFLIPLNLFYLYIYRIFFLLFFFLKIRNIFKN